MAAMSRVARAALLAILVMPAAALGQSLDEREFATLLGGRDADPARAEGRPALRARRSARRSRAAQPRPPLPDAGPLRGSGNADPRRARDLRRGAGFRRP